MIDKLQYKTIYYSKEDLTTFKKTQKSDIKNTNEISIIEDSFLSITAKKINKNLAEIVSKNLDKKADFSSIKTIFLNLKGNEGGDIPSLLKIASYFVKSNQLGWLEDSMKRKTQLNIHQNFKFKDDVSFIVLVDSKTSSGAEFLIRALRHYNNTIIIGEKTAGRGNVEVFSKVPSGGVLKVPVGRMLSVDGHYIDEETISPDIIIDREN